MDESIGTIEPDVLLDEMTLGDPSKVETVLLKWCDKNANAAKAEYSGVLTRIQAADNLYSRTGMTIDATDQANEQEQPVTVPESMNQATTIKAAYSAATFQNGDIWRAHAINGESPARADATKRVVDANFRQKSVNKQVRLAQSRYVDLPYAGFKVCAEKYTARDYERTFYELDQVEQYNRSVLEDGAQPYGEVVTSGGPQYMAQRETTYTDACFYTEAINPRNFCKSSVQRAVQDCFSCHEVHYMTKREIKRKESFVNKELIGQPNAAQDTSLNGMNPGWQGMSGESGNANYPLYEIWETWLEPPWEEWLEDADFSMDDLLAFAQKFTVNADEFFMPQKWQICHIQGKCVLKCQTNYQTDKEMFPYFTASFQELDGSDVGKSFLEVVGDLNSLHNSTYNLLFDSLRLKLYNSMMLDEGVETSDEQLKALFRPKGFVRLRGMANKPMKDQIEFLQFGDISESVLKVIGNITDMLRTYGIPDIMQGIGNSETATQDQINNARGQEKVNAAFRRFIFDCLVPAIEQVIKMIFRNYTRGKYIEVLGEDGNIMADRKFVSPEDITYKISVQPIASWDLASNNVRIQQLTGLLNILGRTMNPAQVLVIAEAIMTYMNLPQYIIDALKEQSGLYTDIPAEIETLKTDPNTPVTVNPMDNHVGALEAIADAINEAIQNGDMMFPYQKNVQDYIMQHHYYLQQQAQQMAMGPPQQGQQGQGSGRRGPQPPGAPADEQGQARQSGQLTSPPDQGANTNAGLTGTASPPA